MILNTDLRGNRDVTSVTLMTVTCHSLVESSLVDVGADDVDVRVDDDVDVDADDDGYDVEDDCVFMNKSAHCGIYINNTECHMTACSWPEIVLLYCIVLTCAKTN